MAQQLEQLSILAHQSNGRWYPNMSEEMINSIDSFLLVHDPSIFEEWLGYKEGGMSDELFAFQARLTVGVDDLGDLGQTEVVIPLSDGSKLLFTEDASRTGLTQFGTVEDEKEVFDQGKDADVRGDTSMKASHYYVENCFAGRFAIVETELVKQVKGKTDEKGQEVFIRPMHPDENWDRTIEHEQGSDKTYYVLDNLEDVEDFLAD